MKYASKVLSFISVGRCGFSSAKLVHQKSEMLLSQVKLEGNVRNRLNRD